MPLAYKGILLNCGYRLDFLIEKSLIIELKAVAKLERRRLLRAFGGCCVGESEGTRYVRGRLATHAAYVGGRVGFDPKGVDGFGEFDQAVDVAGFDEVRVGAKVVS